MDIEQTGVENEKPKNEPKPKIGLETTVKIEPNSKNIEWKHCIKDDVEH